jgi:hypothetical protein
LTSHSSSSANAMQHPTSFLSLSMHFPDRVFAPFDGATRQQCRRFTMASQICHGIRERAVVRFIGGGRLFMTSRSGVWLLSVVNSVTVFHRSLYGGRRRTAQGITGNNVYVIFIQSVRSSASTYRIVLRVRRASSPANPYKLPRRHRASAAGDGLGTLPRLAMENCNQYWLSKSATAERI